MLPAAIAVSSVAWQAGGILGPAIGGFLYAAHPWLPRALFQAFSEAKALSVAELSLVNVLRVSLPWIAAEAEAQAHIMGGDPWPYGFARNRDEVAAMIRYAVGDGLAAHAIEPEALFHPDTLDAGGTQHAQ